MLLITQHPQDFHHITYLKEGDYNYVIEMALAGFSKEDIEIEIARGTSFYSFYKREFRR